MGKSDIKKKKTERERDTNFCNETNNVISKRIQSIFPRLRMLSDVMHKWTLRRSTRRYSFGNFCGWEWMIGAWELPDQLWIPNEDAWGHQQRTPKNPLFDNVCTATNKYVVCYFNFCTFFISVSSKGTYIFSV